MPKYMCPECEAVLKRSQAVPSGKKIKCPKCEFIFAAKAMPDDDEEELAPAKTSTAPKPAPEEAKKPAKPADDDDEGGTYGVKIEAKEEGAEVKFEDLRKKFPKSKRGPAMGMLVGPSNFIMFLGVLNAGVALVYFLIFLWPLLFSNEPPTGSKKTNQIIGMCLSILCFVIAALICYGASKMHELESIQWAWTSVILTILTCGPLGWLAGYYAILQLNKDEVKEGFQETEDRRSELANM